MTTRNNRSPEDAGASDATTGSTSEPSRVYTDPGPGRPIPPYPDTITDVFDWRATASRLDDGDVFTGQTSGWLATPVPFRIEPSIIG